MLFDPRIVGGSRKITRNNIITNQNGNDNTPIAIGSWETIIQPRGLPPQILTVCTGLTGYTLPTYIATGRNIQILGQIVWGIGGTRFVAQFDWKSGNQFCICGDSVEVSAAFFNYVDGVNATEAQVTASVISGTNPSRSQLTRSYPTTTLVKWDGVSNATSMFRIPPFAHSVYIFANQQEFYIPGNSEIAFTAGDVFSDPFVPAGADLTPFVFDGALAYSSLGNEDGIRFPEGSKFLVVRNTSSLFDFQVTPTFTLSL